ncbi:unnamed protein product [Lactuca virosa]|uniref:Guanylate-binding protein/Atlastin C-terminal domain-containing protein n=1 Tax=Lactuca virosa TaxID=75947 RepID=A0AAU9PGE2_9ASTR|nr:unnamed protein product [Lactuca virosa]
MVLFTNWMCKIQIHHYPCTDFHGLNFAQSVEEAECERAYESATDLYVSIFDRTKPTQVAMRETHEEAVQKAMSFFNAIAVGFGSARQKYEKKIHMFLKKAFKDHKKKDLCLTPNCLS